MPSTFSVAVPCAINLFSITFQMAIYEKNTFQIIINVLRLKRALIGLESGICKSDKIIDELLE